MTQTLQLGLQAQASLESDAGQRTCLLVNDTRGRRDIQRSSGGAVVVGKPSWMGCRLPPDLLDIDPEAFPAFKVVFDPASHQPLSMHANSQIKYRQTGISVLVSMHACLAAESAILAVIPP